ncbi:uncharacterized membrane protein YtjA (UPF0391 family) [Paraburkholderia sp. GAS448]
MLKRTNEQALDEAERSSKSGEAKPTCNSVIAHWANYKEGSAMLQYALIFFIIAIIAAVLGFGGIAVGAAAIAKILFYIFVVIFLVTLLLGVARR